MRLALIAIALVFVTFGGYYRIRSQQPGESLDRSREGWPLFAAIRLTGLLTVAATAFWLHKTQWPAPSALRWTGVICFALSVAWLIWMFHTLGRNLTDTVVTRREAFLVIHGPYRYVRNPMYTGVLMAGMSLGLALRTWLLPGGSLAMFALFAVRTRIEERYLIERFGDAYRDYMQTTGRFFPRL